MAIRSDPVGIKKLATSYSRTSGRRTTLGDGALDFRVRNGNGYDNSSMATGKKCREPETKETYNPSTRGGKRPRSEVLKKQAKPHAILVPIGSTDRSACTSGLSRSWSTTWLQSIAAGKTCLGGGLALRCFQRLSVPNVATRPAAGATTEAPLVRDSRSSRTRESSPQSSCAHRG